VNRSSLVKRWFVPFDTIERSDDVLMVSGYAFVNETVPVGDDRILRSAMELATSDYMKWANIREMHGKNVAGVAMEVVWDAHGARMTGKIVDPLARRKVEEGAYKGYSIGVIPKIRRADGAVQELTWYETSLVDRPSDPDAVMSIARADIPDEEIPDVTAPVVPLTALTPAAEPVPSEAVAATEEPAAADERGMGLASADVPLRENLEPKYPKGMTVREDLLPKCPVCGSICRVCKPETRALTEEQQAEGGHGSPPKGYPEGKGDYADPANYKYPIDTADRVRAAWSYIHQAKNREPYSDTELSAIEAKIKAAAKKFDIEISEERTLAPVPEERLAAPPADETSLLTRMVAMESQLATVSGLLSTKEQELSRAIERIAKLENEPAPVVPPARFAVPLERTFAANGDPQLEAEYRHLTEQFETLVKSPPGTPEEMRERAISLNKLKRSLHAFDAS
jgi:uncharacterized protein DUF6582